MLRFYADCGLVLPRWTDPATGYRFYSSEQVDDVHVVRRLRDLGMPLIEVRELLTGAGHQSQQAIERRLAALEEEWLRAQDSARVALALLQRRQPPRVRLSGSALAAALRRVGRAAAKDKEFPVLGGVLVQITADDLRIVATDRYRLAMQSLAITGRAEPSVCVLPSCELPTIIRWAERCGELTMQSTDGRLHLFAHDGETINVQGLAERFPDYEAMFAGLPAATTSAVVPRVELLDLLEMSAVTRLQFDPAGTIEVQSDGAGSVRAPAVVRGHPLDISFRRDTLLPAVADSIGPDVLLEMTRPDAPAILRSADDGTFITLAMPTLTHDRTKDTR